MASETLPKALADLNAVLRSGDLSRLEGLAALLSELQPKMGGLTLSQVQSAQSLAVENSALLLACMSGVESAKRRLKEIQQASVALNTYDPQGRRCPLPTYAPSFRRF